MWNFLYLGVCLLFSLLLVFFIKMKARIKSKENELFEASIYVCIFSIITEIILQIMASYKLDNEISTIFNKLYLVLIVLWFVVFSKYIFYIFKPAESKQNFETEQKKFLKKYRIINNIHNFMGIIFSIIVCILPIKCFLEGAKMYSYGPAVDFLRIVLAIFIISWIVVSIKNYKRLKNIKYLPILVVIILLVLNIIIQQYEPSVLIVSFTFTFLSYILYHTIENPDIKMVNQLEYAKAQADKANKAKSEFLSSMSHEIRTPMNGIVGIAEYLRTENLSDEGRSLLDDLERVSNTLLEITSGIINISKIEQGAVDIVEKDYNIRETVDDICTYLKPRLKDRPIDFKVEYAPDLPEILFGDKGKIREIITNLLTNSIKYTEKGSINLNIMCINEEDCCKLTIIVSDTGIGIREEMMNKLFEKFSRDEDVTNTTIEGTGLGLAITKKLVDMLNGKITVSSVRGNGTTFTVYLAQKYSQNKTRITEIDEETKEVIKQEEKVESIKEVKDKEIETLEDNTTKVLIVDDNDLNLKVQKRHLYEYGYQVDTCKSGEECLKLLEHNKYDLILMDDMMPDISGTETMKKIKNDLKLTTPIVVITGNAKEEDRDNYLKEGFDEYLAKPFKKEELKQVIKKVFG